MSRGNNRPPIRSTTSTSKRLALLAEEIESDTEYDSTWVAYFAERFRLNPKTVRRAIKEHGACLSPVAGDPPAPAQRTYHTRTKHS